jgi:hypothetical protein
VSTFWRSSLGRGCSQISSVLSWFLQHNRFICSILFLQKRAIAFWCAIALEMNGSL